jgi:sigma-B regulation protein RsbU (phosphoserine phosphatase)
MSSSPEHRLRYNVLFEALSDELFADLRPRLRERRFHRGQVIIENASEGDELFLIVDGRVRIHKPVQGSAPHTLAILHPGDFFGELELVDSRPRSATVTAIDDCLLYGLHQQDFEDLIARSHPFSTRLLQVLSLRLRSLTNHFLRELRSAGDQKAAELDRLEKLIEAAKNVNSTLDLDRVLAIVVDNALQIVGCEHGTLYLVDEEKREIWSKVLRESRLVEIRLAVGQGIAGYVAATGDVLNIRDVYEDIRFDPEFDRLSGFRTTTMLCMPVRNPAGVIIGVLQLLNKNTGVFTRNDESFIAALSVHAAIAIENARLHEAEKTLNRMREEIRLAARIQLDLLPKSAPVIPGYALAGRSIPARSVGGDYFDFIPIDDHRIAVAIGDVSGKGLPASLLMATVQATLRGQTLTGSPPEVCLQRSNRLLFESTSPDKFVTLFYLILDREAHRLTFCNGGQDNPFLFGPTGEPVRLIAGGPPVAVLDEFPYEQGAAPIEPGGVLVLYTDGITEAMTEAGEQSGEERLAWLLQTIRELPADRMIERILEDVARHCAGAPQADDQTIVVVRRDR